MKKSLAEINSILKQHLKEISEQYKVKELGIFGSYIRGKEQESSDIDILVEFKQPIGFFKYLELEEYLGDLLQIKVDLVSKKALKPHIGKYILEEVVIV